MDYRFRIEGKLLVLQVQDYPEYPAPRSWQTTAIWRDAKVEDIPVFGPFTPPTTREIVSGSVYVTDEQYKGNLCAGVE